MHMYMYTSYKLLSLENKNYFAHGCLLCIHVFGNKVQIVIICASNCSKKSSLRHLNIPQTWTVNSNITAVATKIILNIVFSTRGITVIIIIIIIIIERDIIKAVIVVGAVKQ